MLDAEPKNDMLIAYVFYVDANKSDDRIVGLRLNFPIHWHPQDDKP